MSGQKVHGWRDLLNKYKGERKGQNVKDTRQMVGEDIKSEEDDKKNDLCKDKFDELEALVANEHQSTRWTPLFRLFNKKRWTV